MLEKEVCVFINMVLCICLTRARNGACRCVGYCDYFRSEVIHYFKVKSPTEIHGALSEVCCVFTVDRSTVSGWANRFRGGCVNLDNDPRPERPSISTYERSVKLVAECSRRR